MWRCGGGGSWGICLSSPIDKNPIVKDEYMNSYRYFLGDSVIAKGQLRNDTRTSAHRLALGHTRNPTTHETNTNNTDAMVVCGRASAVASRLARAVDRFFNRPFYNTVTDRRGY